MGSQSVWTSLIFWAIVVIFYFICVFYTAPGGRVKTDCPDRTDANRYQLNLNLLAKDHPILWDPETKQLISGANGTVHLHHGQNLGISCIESSFKNLPLGRRQSFIASNDNGQLKLGKSVFDLSRLSCGTPIKSSVLRTNKPCSGGQLLHIGYHDTKFGWINASSTCFDEKTEMIRYTHFQLCPTKDNEYPRPNNFFKDDQLYRGYSAKDIKKLYAIEEQKKTFHKLLGSHKKINEKKKFFLNKGHVVARLFYNLKYQQISTFNYVNISPQWVSINSGNMNILEQGLVRYVNETGKSVDVYAGVHGILQFEHSVTKELKELYLDASNKKFPIPKIFYFYVVQENIVLVVVNNPYVNEEHIDQDYTFGCTNISDHKILNYMALKKGKRFGLTYAFSPAEFSIKTGIHFQQTTSEIRSDFQFMY